MQRKIFYQPIRFDTQFVEGMVFFTIWQRTKREALSKENFSSGGRQGKQREERLFPCPN